MKKNIIPVCFLLLALLACKKKVEKERPEFIGHWYVQSVVDMHLDMEISESSYAIYDLYSEGRHFIYKGNARANDDKLSIGSIRYFNIIEYPHQIDTNLEKHYIYFYHPPKLATWKMVLDGIKPNDNHFCGEAKYYRVD